MGPRLQRIPIQRVRESIALSLGHARLLFAIAAILLFAAGFARAQEGMLPPPDASYGGKATNYPPPTDPPMPTLVAPPPPPTVTIPMPHGRDVTGDAPEH